MANKNKPKAHFPKFLGIGAARSATTWLSDRLSAHPDVWIPRIKELHYFTRAPKYFGPSHLNDTSLVRKLTSGEQSCRRYRQKLYRAVGSNLLRPSVSKLRWDANYLLRRPGDRWYASLFTQGHSRVTGEITPRYAALEADDISRLQELMPEVKIIYIMRDPVERAWSLVRYHAKKYGRPLTALPYPDLLKRVFHPSVQRQSDYESILERWRQVFPPEQLLILYYDDVANSPDALLKRIATFLGIDPAPPGNFAGPGAGNSSASRRVNASNPGRIPLQLEQTLIDFYRPMVARLSESEGGYFRAWLHGYELRSRGAQDSDRVVPFLQLDALELGNGIA